MSEKSTLVVSDSDFNTLISLASSGSSESMGQLEDELNRAQVVPAEKLPEDVVAMHSTVEVVDLDSGAQSRLTLVLPHEADASSNKVSILAPMGVALIGLRAGQSREWTMPNGKEKHFQVRAVEPPKAA